MGLFGKKKEPDMKCWNCDKLISHKQVKLTPRKMGMPGETSLGTELLTNQMRELAKSMSNSWLTIIQSCLDEQTEQPLNVDNS